MLEEKVQRCAGQCQDALKLIASAQRFLDEFKAFHRDSNLELSPESAQELAAQSKQPKPAAKVMKQKAKTVQEHIAEIREAVTKLDRFDQCPVNYHVMFYKASGEVRDLLCAALLHFKFNIVLVGQQKIALKIGQNVRCMHRDIIKAAIKYLYYE